MFKRKDVIRTLFLLMIIVVIMVTLSQILVVHRRNHVSSKSRDTKKANAVLALIMHLEKSIEAMMKKDYLPARKYEDHILAEIYSERIKQQLVQIVSSYNAQTSENRRASGDSIYTVFHDRKLRFLDMTYNDISRAKHKNNVRVFAQRQKEKDLHAIEDKTKYVNKSESTSELQSNNTDLPEIELSHSVPSTANSEDHVEQYAFDNHEIMLPKNNRVYYKHTSNSSTEALKKKKEHVHSDENIDLEERNRTAELAAYPRDPCPEIPNTLEGHYSISSSEQQHLTNHIRFLDIHPGGFWKPTTCVARQRTAIIIPYRDREKHLYTLLQYLIPLLKRQLLDFRIFVVEQYGRMTFNKGRVMNAGFKEAWKLCNFDCVIYHDVDLLPENDKNMYTCGRFPRHMSISVDKFSYRLPYWTLVGGVFSIRREQFLLVNGYSNLYWGWGAEDDDMAYRLKTSNLKIERPPANIGRYTMIKHENRETSPVKMRAYLLKTVRKRYHRDGLNTLEYRLVFISNTNLYTHVMVDIGQPPKEAANITKLLN